MNLARRTFLQALPGAAAFSPSSPVLAEAGRDFPIGACDWSIGRKQDIAAFDVADAIGLEGLQVSFSTPGSEFDLRNKKVRQRYYERIDETGIRIASLGMGILNQMPLATHPDAIDWVDDAIDTLVLMQEERPADAPTVCLLAFFGEGDINGQPELMEAVIERLATVATKANDQGVVLGIESLLSADDHLKIIDGVGSPAVQVYYDTANSHRMGYDIYEEVLRLGAERICEVHCKENGALLGEGEIDFARFRDSLVAAGYDDWLVIEGSIPSRESDVVDAYRRNFATLDRIFGKR